MVVWEHDSKKKVTLQYAVLVVALVLASQFLHTGSLLHTLSFRVTENIAGVIGMSVGVPPNETNLLAQELRSKEMEISDRERALDARERDIRSVVADETAKQGRIIVFILFGVVLFLGSLIGVNFYLDYRRKQMGDEHTKPPNLGPHTHEGEFTTKL